MEYFFPDKSNNLETITLVENNMIISDNQKITDPFIEYIDTMVPKLGLAIPKDVIATNGMKEKNSIFLNDAFQSYYDLFQVEKYHSILKRVV